MNYDNFQVEIDGRVAVVTIDNPKALNAMSQPMMEDFGRIMTELAGATDVGAIILTGSGEKAFMAGGDIAGMQPLGAFEARAVALKSQDIYRQIEGCATPVICAINGYVLGGGCELAMCCDIRIASEHARFGQPEIKIGIIPGFGGTQRLARLVGLGAARKMIYTGEMIDAAEALRIGLTDIVVPAAELMSEARKLAASIAEKSSVAIGLAKQAINNGYSMDLNRACAYEAEQFGLCFASYDQKEGMLAFLEKRPAKFEHR
ncbi:MAG: enoyl-CoA hydratase-related protein [Desulfuromonadales bacterium]|nr:enoyl-CoA hydratase-related protein [Desulfuromonadales bacterium]